MEGVWGAANLPFDPIKRKKIRDDSELKQSGLDFVVGFLSVVLACRASQILLCALDSARALFSFIVVLFFSSEVTFPSGPAVKHTLTRYRSHSEVLRTAPLVHVTPGDPTHGLCIQRCKVYGPF